MKIILLSTAALLIAGAVGGYGYEAVVLRHTHAQGFALPLTDFTFEIIYAIIFGVIGCLIGMAINVAHYLLKRRSKVQTVSH
jgi:hypothetical protein